MAQVKVQSFGGCNTFIIEPGVHPDNVRLYCPDGAVFDREALVKALGSTAPDLAAVRKALADMPYLPLPGYYSDSVRTLDDLAKVLTHLASVLKGVRERNRKIEEERDSLLRQRNAMREFLGT